MQGKDIRSTFLQFFKNNNHTICKSSSLIPSGDSTLLFTNAGMVQFKDIFLGITEVDYARAASSQKCVRAGGKHNDLEMVGKTARHHTFFEMLGNFSFGDYFKDRAIEMGWEFLTKVIALPEKRLLVTVYKDDDEAYNIWLKKIKIPESRILRLDEKDNFWSMGDTGPCGPCSEIIYDQGEDVGCRRDTCSIECDCDRFLELWNLVFMQFNRNKDGSLTSLPNPSIDTGMGIERLSAVVQGKQTNFDCDLIFPLIGQIEDIVTSKYGDSKKTDISFNVISDHIRSATFLISDGIVPSNEGRGYVLRRIIRRALRHGKIIGISAPFFYKMSEGVISLMQDAYPELADNREYISKVIVAEEERFESTLTKGLAILNDLIEYAKKDRTMKIKGDDLFKLYDTYGFPVDMAVEVAEESGVSADMDGFNSSMESQVDMARASWTGGADADFKAGYKDIARVAGKVKFLGYNSVSSDAEVIFISKDCREVEEARAGEVVEIICNQTPFYGESGGQTGDTGRLWNDNVSMDCIATLRPFPDIISHRVRLSEGKIRKGESLTLNIDEEKRRRIVKNHSGTHLLHSSLKEIIGKHVRQAGSLVEAERLRFDYTHFSKTSDKELEAIERLVNEKVLENMPIRCEELSYAEAINKGATALFGEKYGETVRMISMGDFSIELCGGTHAAYTGEIGLFIITSESGVASGTRRIEAVTGKAAYDYIKKAMHTLSTINTLVKGIKGEEVKKVEKLIEHSKTLERQNDMLQKRLFQAMADTIASDKRLILNIPVVSASVNNIDLKRLRILLDMVKDKIKSGVVVLGTVAEGKVILVAGITKDIAGKLHAGNILKRVSLIVDGSGGGRPDMAQAGGKEPAKIGKALETVFEIVEEALDNPK